MENNNTIECWKDVKGYEGLYQVSDLGRVRSLDRTVHDYLNGGIKLHKGRILKGGNSKGYIRVALSKDGKKKGHAVHRLVAEAFIPNPGNKSQVNHINKNRGDNRVENLEWVTAKENSVHAYHSENNYGKIEYHAGLLNEAQIKEVKKLYYLNGLTTHKLIDAVKSKYGVEITPHTISLMDDLSIWRDVEIF